MLRFDPFLSPKAPSITEIEVLTIKMEHLSKGIRIFYLEASCYAII
jgi:hypothetical protein